VDELLDKVKHEFAEIYNPKRTAYTDFDDTFRQLLKESEARAEELKKMKQQNKLPEAPTKRQGQTTNQKDGSQAKGGKNSSKAESKTGADDDDAHKSTKKSGINSLSNGK